MEFKAQHDYLLVRPLDDQDRTNSGILLAGSVNIELERGEVVSAGPGSFQSGVWVATRSQIGDVVYYAKEVTTGVNINNEPLVIIRDTHVVLTSGEVDGQNQNRRTITHIVAGNAEWHPTQTELDELVTQFTAAQFDPVGGVWATREGVDVRQIDVYGTDVKIDPVQDIDSDDMK
jgi:chaperonin GroES